MTRQTSSRPPPTQGEGAAPLAMQPAPVDQSEMIAGIQLMFMLLSRYDDRFGHNGYFFDEATGEQKPGSAKYEGWQTPALQAYYQQKGCTDQYGLEPDGYRAIAWNLGKLLTRYQQTACILPL